MAYRTTDELVTAIGQDLRQLRKQAGLSQALLAQKAGISERALRNLESGQGSSLATFIGVLKALRQDTVLDALSRPAELSPMQLLRQRGGHGRA
jgi:transcriptional regulator with XRE-family HTH domain